MVLLICDGFTWGKRHIQVKVGTLLGQYRMSPNPALTLLNIIGVLGPGKTRTHCGSNIVSCNVARPWKTRQHCCAPCGHKICVGHKCCARGKTKQHSGNMITSAYVAATICPRFAGPLGRKRQGKAGFSLVWTWNPNNHRKKWQSPEKNDCHISLTEHCNNTFYIQWSSVFQGSLAQWVSLIKTFMACSAVDWTLGSKYVAIGKWN